MQTITESPDRMDRTAWDRRLASVPYGSFFQSTAYGDLCCAELDEEPHYARVEENGRVLGQLLWFGSYWARDWVAPFGSRVTRVWRHLAPASRWQFGPVVFDASRAEAVTRQLLTAAASAANVSAAIPAVHALLEDSATDEILPDEWHFEVRAEGTMVLDLTPPIDHLWRNVWPDGKRNVRRAAREGITIRKVDDDAGRAEFYDVYAQNCRRCGIVPKPFRRIVRTIQCSAFHHVFLSVQDRVTTSAQAAIVWNGIVYLTGCSVSDFGFRHGLHGNDLMQWHMIEWAKSIDARLIDWAGYTLAPSPRQDGINRFKAKWGGRLLTYKTYSRIHPVLRLPLKWYRGDMIHPIAAD